MENRHTNENRGISTKNKNSKTRSRRPEWGYSTEIAASENIRRHASGLRRKIMNGEHSTEKLQRNSRLVFGCFRLRGFQCYSLTFVASGNFSHSWLSWEWPTFSFLCPIAVQYFSAQTRGLFSGGFAYEDFNAIASLSSPREIFRIRDFPGDDLLFRSCVRSPFTIFLPTG